MKHLVLALLLTAGCLRADTLVVSDFSNFAPSVLLTPQPVNPADGPWTDATAQSGATAYTIGDFGAGAPSGLTGNGFIQYLAGAEDWSAFSYLTLTGLTAAANATPSLSFYIEDADFNVSSVNVFDLANFASGASISLLLDLSGLNTAQIVGWGFVTNEADAAAFGFTFDHLELSTEQPAPPTVPDAGPGFVGVFAMVGVLGLARFRRQAV